ncbi:MAG: DUF6567 family protein [Bacteroidales bacterium]|nr:DUF6567 family protein [Bacteroidales bacterium]MEE1118401.1 DUF6567 family protein [Bacteroidales bacterium]
MKRKIFLAVIALGVIFGLSSCATHSKLQNFTESTVILHSANFEYVKTVKEDASATYILGFCGGNPEQKAIDRLKETAALKPNQTLANYSFVKSNRIILGLVSIKTITVTADVIEFK